MPWHTGKPIPNRTSNSARGWEIGLKYIILIAQRIVPISNVYTNSQSRRPRERNHTWTRVRWLTSSTSDWKLLIRPGYHKKKFRKARNHKPKQQNDTRERRPVRVRSFANFSTRARPSQHCFNEGLLIRSTAWSLVAIVKGFLGSNDSDCGWTGGIVTTVMDCLCILTQF